MIQTISAQAQETTETVTVSLEGVPTTGVALGLGAIGVILIALSALFAWKEYNAKKAASAALAGNVGTEALSVDEIKKLIEAWAKLSAWQAYLLTGLIFVLAGAWLLVPDVSVIVTNTGSG